MVDGGGGSWRGVGAALDAVESETSTGGGGGTVAGASFGAFVVEVREDGMPMRSGEGGSASGAAAPAKALPLTARGVLAVEESGTCDEEGVRCGECGVLALGEPGLGWLLIAAFSSGSIRAAGSSS